jgi:hypothetical protein
MEETEVKQGMSISLCRCDYCTRHILDCTVQYIHNICGPAWTKPTTNIGFGSGSSPCQGYQISTTSTIRHLSPCFHSLSSPNSDPSTRPVSTKTSSSDPLYPVAEPGLTTGLAVRSPRLGQSSAHSSSRRESDSTHQSWLYHQYCV